MRRPVIALTMGDPGGIGPEVILKTLARLPQKNITRVVFGNPEVFFRAQKKTARRIPMISVSSLEDCYRKGGLYFFDIREDAARLLGLRRQPFLKTDFPFHPGHVSRTNAAQAYAALQKASEAATQGLVDALVTAPLNKTAMKTIDPDFHGHTEFLARAAKVKSFAMMFVSTRLKVTLVTIHLALRKVSSQIKARGVLEKIELTDGFLKKYWGIRHPRIAVCALNPHGRETGCEDDLEIVPAVRAAFRKGIQAHGPFSADQLFFDAYQGRYDAVISMYHDQGLAPFKMIAFKDGVNVTLGLPFIRTSPDHGTAFDIAYRDKADPSSFAAALSLAEKLVSR